MKNIEIKLILNTKKAKQDNASILKDIQALLLAPMNYRQIKINPKTSLDTTRKYLESKLDCSARSGTTDGCYGARTGGSTEGITLWVHPKELTDRCVESEDNGKKTEYVNPWFLFEENGELVPDLDGEDFEKMMEMTDIEGKADNTYNFNGHSSDDASLMFDFQFTTFETPKNGLLVSVMFHCGGDPRGNYTSKVVYKFKYAEDFHSVIFPSKHILGEE
jgi:hypothetical protein